jgi:hypothetical protein
VPLPVDEGKHLRIWRKFLNGINPLIEQNSMLAQPHQQIQKKGLIDHFFYWAGMFAINPVNWCE